jgi:uncharacterized delta-60 repeat protein/gliding motility-associated-like protein
MINRHSIFTVLFSVLCYTGTAQTIPGTLDPSFYVRGIKEFSFQPKQSMTSVAASCLQPDGKLLVVMVDGNAASNYAGYTDAVVLRLLPDGKLDNTFGTSGRVSLRKNVPLLIESKSSFVPSCITLRPDGRMLIGGYSFYQTDYPTLVSLKTGGEVDETFGDGSGYVKDLINPNLRFVTLNIYHATGVIYAGTDFATRFTVLAYDSFGKPALVFNKNIAASNIKQINLTAVMSDKLSAANIHQKDGILYLAGRSDISNINSINRFSITALNLATDQLIPVFGNTGAIIIDDPGENQNFCSALCFSADSSQLILAGSSSGNFSGISTALLYRINRRSGALDETFGNTIGIRFSFDESNTISSSYVRSITALTDGRYLASGISNDGSVNNYAAISVLKANGTLDPSFNGSGSLVYSTTTTNTKGASVHFSKATGTVLALTDTPGNLPNTYANIKSVFLNGSPNNAYGDQSELGFALADEPTAIEDIVPRADGKVWVCGNTPVNTYPATLALLNADGSLDKSFSNQAGDQLGTQSLLNLGLPLGNTRVYAIAETQAGKLVVAGNYRPSANAIQQGFVLQLKNNGNGSWALDTGFGDNGNGYVTTSSTSDVFVQDLLVYPDGSPLLYYAYQDIPNSKNYVAFSFWSSSGVAGPSTTILITDNLTFNPPLPQNRWRCALQDGLKVVAVTTTYGNPNGIYYNGTVFRLDENLNVDQTFGNNPFNTDGYFRQEFTTRRVDFGALCLKQDGRIAIGGTVQKVAGANSQYDYAFIQMTKDGKTDPSFAKNGLLLLDLGPGLHEVSSLAEEPSSGALVATAESSSNGSVSAYSTTALRITPQGKSDKTFAGNTGSLLTSGAPTASALLGGNLYVFGQRRTSDDNGTGFLARVALGNGPPIKETFLSLQDKTVKFGEAPFVLKPITNSPAPVYYTALTGCVAVDATTGLVQTTCVANDPSALIRAIQPAVAGFSADTAIMQLAINPGIHRIVFASQGDTVSTTAILTNFLLSATSNSGALPFYSQVPPASTAITLETNGSVTINEEGSTMIRVDFPAKGNYEAGFATATVYAYTNLQAPDANADEASLVFGEATSVSIDLLANDQAYTGSLDPTSIDLDPAQAGVQKVYVSPALGLFEVDSTGLVTYVPFAGFIGSGDITYTLRDSKGSLSPLGILHVAVVLSASPPDLKATQLITPNGDGLNEAFVIGFVNLDKPNKLKIFDRNGEELLTKNDYQNDWSGQLANGKKAENGIYYYVFIEGNGSGTRELKGVVEVRR